MGKRVGLGHIWVPEGFIRLGRPAVGSAVGHLWDSG